MISILSSKVVPSKIVDGVRKSRELFTLAGLSTDTKPVTEYKGILIRNGSVYDEIDTGKEYLYDEAGGEWHEQPEGDKKKDDPTAEEISVSRGSADAGKVIVVGNDGKLLPVDLEVGEGQIAVDGTLKIPGAAADAKKTGDALASLNGSLGNFIEDSNGWVSVSLNVLNDGYYDKDGAFQSATTRAYATVNSVSPGDRFKISTRIGHLKIPGIVYFNDGAFVSYDLLGNGTNQDISDREFTVPSGVDQLIVQSTAKAVSPTLSKYETVTDVKVYLKSQTYSKSETYSKAEINSMSGRKRYGVRWSLSDASDTGSRCFDAVGFSATIGVGSTNGSSDFDNVYPWSDIKRCNIVKNENGAETVVFEGESGFALDGSNGDVFVRIPVFCYERYCSGGYEYRVISEFGATPHPAFVENGVTLDAIYIGAFEGYVSSGKLRSMGNVLPTSNITAQNFLTNAQANGNNYSLYDMRCVDAVWSLFAVEYGCRNTNRIFGYGLADFEQPAQTVAKDKIILASTSTNTVRTVLWTSAQKLLLPVGGNITVCDTKSTNILTQAKLISVSDGADYTEWTFDGQAINVTTNCFIGAAAFNTNWCENVPSGALSWHTGRAAWATGGAALIRNPMRYRWIENLFGNLWHFLPDVTFYNLQMYVCKSMKDYVMHKHTSPYMPVNALYTAQESNGYKGDTSGVNYWVSTLDDGQFAKAVDFGRSFDTSLTSDKAFGAYYYLYDNTDVPYIISNGGGFDHLYRCNMLTQRAWQDAAKISYLYGARLIYKNIA